MSFSNTLDNIKSSAIRIAAEITNFQDRKLIYPAGSDNLAAGRSKLEEVERHLQLAQQWTGEAIEVLKNGAVK